MVGCVCGRPKVWSGCCREPRLLRAACLLQRMAAELAACTELLPVRPLLLKGVFLGAARKCQGFRECVCSQAEEACVLTSVCHRNYVQSVCMARCMLLAQPAPSALQPCVRDKVALPAARVHPLAAAVLHTMPDASLST